MTRRILSAIFKLIFVFACGLGIYLNLTFSSGYNFKIFAYYTFQSNLLCLITMAVLFFFELTGRKYNDSFFYQTFKFCAVVCILLTFFIYRFLLASHFTHTDNSTIGIFANHLVHTVSPIMFFLDWLLFDKKRAFRWENPILGLILPLLYLVFLFIYAKLGGRFGSSTVPYFFLNYNTLGWGGVLKWIGIISAGTVLIGYTLCVLDRVLPGKHSRRRK